jgi:hypothetical protein
LRIEAKVSRIAAPPTPGPRAVLRIARAGSWTLSPWAVGLLAALLISAVALTVAYQLKIDRANVLASSVRDVENLARALEDHVVHAFMNADELAWSIKQQVEKRGLPDDLKSFLHDRSLPGTPFLLAMITDEMGNSV